MLVGRVVLCQWVMPNMLVDRVVLCQWVMPNMLVGRKKEIKQVEHGNKYSLTASKSSPTA